MPRKTGRGRRATAALPPRFNEAAARCHGKRRRSRRRAAGRGRFNEAAARCHGKRVAAYNGSYLNHLLQ